MSGFANEPVLELPIAAGGAMSGFADEPVPEPRRLAARESRLAMSGFADEPVPARESLLAAP